MNATAPEITSVGAAFATLAAAIVADPVRLTVVEAMAGAGKTVLLETLAALGGGEVQTKLDALPDDARLLLLDLPPSRDEWNGLELLLDWLRKPDRRAVIAKRPALVMAGLDRAVLSGKAKLICDQQLLTAVLDDGAEPESGGWPILLSPELGSPMGPDRLAGYLDSEILAGCDMAELTMIEAVARDPAGLLVTDSTGLTWPDAVRGLIRIEDDRWRISAETARPLLHELAARRLSTLSDPETLLRRAQLLRRLGQPAHAISLLIDAGQGQLALEWFEAEGGYNFVYYWGNDLVDIVLAAFDSAGLLSDETVMARALRALKSGQLEGARQILQSHFGPDALTLSKVYAVRSPFSWQYRLFRAIVAIYESAAVPDDIIERMFVTLEQVPEGADIRRGNLFNALLEIYLRRRRLPEAESMAARALASYRRADAPMLCFYIELFQAILATQRGDISAAQQSTAQARLSLAASGVGTRGDWRIQELVEATLDYEQGQAAPLAHFLLRDLDRFADSELWPSLVEFVIDHGGMALLEHASVFSALEFLDRWRIHRWPARSLRMTIEIAAARVLQKGNRWLQAAAVLSPLQSRVNRNWAETAVAELSFLADHAEIDMTLTWMRALIYDVPNRAMLRHQISLLMGNHHITARQRLTLGIWDAYVCRRQNDMTASRVGLLTTFEAAARLSCLAPLREEASFVSALLGDRRLVAFLRTSSIARQVLGKLDSIERSSNPEVMGLTRREARILALIAEGGSNKFVARTLEISEVTVKFHLSNLYRKLGCANRSQAIATARSMGWIK